MTVAPDYHCALLTMPRGGAQVNGRSHIRCEQTFTKPVLTMAIASNRSKVEVDFTNDVLTSAGGVYFLAEAARRLGLSELIEKGLRLKQRKRGSSDADTLMSLVLSLAQGNGALSDLDRLRARLDARLRGHGLDVESVT